VLVPIAGVAIEALVLDMGISRWMLGAWVAVTALWLLAATLMLVQIWPEISVARDGGMLFGSSKHKFVLGDIRVALGENISKVLLFLLAPPGFLLAILWLGLRIVGLPFPNFRPGQGQPKTG
jgi:hypothetical protein